MKNDASRTTILEEQDGILIVVDDDVSQPLQRKLTNKGYKCYQASHDDQALDKLRINRIGLVILDINTQGMSRINLLSAIKANHPYTAVVVATPVGGTTIGVECIKLGADDCMTKPLILEEVVLVAGRVLEKRGMELFQREYQQHLQDRVGEQAEKIRNSFFQAITALAHALEAKDRYTSGHSQRVAELSVAISNKMGLSQESTEKIRMAGLVHDIGKIGVNDSVLNKPTRLTHEELRQVRRHPEIGEHILAPIVNDSETLKLVRNHHENCDGTGYPDRLTDSQIPLGTKILAVADAYDAMTSERPYRKAMSNKVAFAELERKKGTQFDPEVVAVLYSLQKCDL